MKIRCARAASAAAAAMLVPSAAAAQDAPAVTFRPAGPWAAEYADHTCRLIRNFSGEAGEITLAFERFGFGPQLRLGLAGDALQASSRVREVKFRFSGETRSRESALQRSVLADGRPSYLLPAAALLPASEVERVARAFPDAQALAEATAGEVAAAARITSIAFTEGFAGDPVIETGSLEAPMKAMQACSNDLLTTLGMDPARLATMSRAAEPTSRPQTWLKYSDYPEDMGRARIGGVVSVRLIVTEQGKVEHCLVDVEVQGPFEKTVCANVMEAASFKPALDGEGRPMRSYWMNNVVFVP